MGYFISSLIFHYENISYKIKRSSAFLEWICLLLEASILSSLSKQPSMNGT